MIHATIIVPIGNGGAISHRVTRSLATGKKAGYLLLSRPLNEVRHFQLGDRLDEAGTYWWDRRRTPPGARR